MLDLDKFTILDQEEYQENYHSQHGSEPHLRELEKFITRGFIILDKPVGPTSHDTVATVKKILGVNKAGHSGTLDPAVSGVLPIAIEDGTKILSLINNTTKQYICNLHLHDEVPIDQVRQVLRDFNGLIYQFPPLKSNVAMRLRKRTIYQIEAIEQHKNSYLLDIKCEAGTYIRTLCIDLGKILGVGGEMKELRRVKSSVFHEDDTITLHDLFDGFSDANEGITEEKLRNIILPIEQVVSHIPGVLIKDNAVPAVSNGAKLAIPGIVGYQDFQKGDPVRILTCKGEIVAIGEALQKSDVLKSNKKGMIAQPRRVIFNRDEYNV